MKITSSLIIKFKEISRHCNEPEKVQQIMKHTIKESLELLRLYYVVDLLRSLRQQRIGLQSVEVQVRRLCETLPNRKKALINTIMTWKLKDANSKLRRQRYVNTKVWREARTELRQNGVLERYTRIWKSETEKVKKRLRTKRKKKIQFLSQKYRNKVDIPNMYEGITIEEQPIPETFSSEPRCYGGCTIDENEKSVLKLPPKFAVYSNVDSVTLEAQIEKGLAKYRWDKNKNDRNVNELTAERETDYMMDENCTIDMRSLRATELPFNKRVCLPPPLSEPEEIALQHLKSKMLTSVNSYVEENVNSKEWLNLNKDERKGLKSLKKRCREKDIVVYQTDKSGRFSVDTTDNYIKACVPHFVNDEIITEHEYRKMELKMNAHSCFWTRILQAGKDTGHMARIRGNMITIDTPLAPLYCLRKDHKAVDDPDVGPPMRPVCGATASYNGRLSHVMSKLLQGVWMNEPDVCLSTEELLAAIRGVNDKRLADKIMVGSADVKALYPSLDIDFTIEKVCEVFYESKIVIDGTDIDELGLYLSLNCSEQYLTLKGISEFCPKRKTNRGRPPLITGCASEENKEKRYSKWNYAQTKPDVQTSRKMLVEALRVALLFIMKNHVYTFNNVIYRQVKGGPIGLELTGVLAQVFMVWWDRELKRRMRDVGLQVHLYKRYVDDINIIMTIPQENEKEVYVRDCMLQIDGKCMKFVKTIADDIHQSIKVEVDYPSNHSDKKIPILDVKVWIGEHNEMCVVLHEFYSKEISSKLVIHPRSAVPFQTKRTILTQQVLRVLLNCSPLLPWEHTIKHVNEMVARMQYSGYEKSFRYHVVRAAIKAYRKILELEQEGIRPLYRPKDWNMEERQRSKREKRINWYKDGHYSSVIFVPVTPNSALKKMLDNDVKEANAKIRIVESMQTNIKRVVQRSNPFENKVCGSKDCFICETSGSGRCRAQGVTYEIECKDCKLKYIGETSRNGFTRGKEHIKDLDTNNEKSVLRLHCNEKHAGVVQDFDMKVTNVFNGDPMLRQISEAVKIKKEGNNVMNTKSEWNTVRIPRANIELL